MESINFVSPNIGMNNYDKQLIEEGLCNSNQRENSNLYSFPGILHFLQSEWNKMESERAHWEIEKAELMAKIAFLQGEKKGQECLKEDLVRRIKMLEYALKQKNQTINELKYPNIKCNDVSVNSSKNNVEDASHTKIESNVKLNADIEKAKAATYEWRESRQRLRRFLQEVGYVDSVLDVRQCRFRNLQFDGRFSEENNGRRNPDEGLIDAENSAIKDFDFLIEEREQSIKCDEYSNDPSSNFNKRLENDNIQYENRFNSKKFDDEKQGVFKLKGKNVSKFGRGSKRDHELQDILAQLNDGNLQNDDAFNDKDKNKENLGAGANDIDNFTSSFGLGDLATLTVANEVDGDVADASKQFTNSRPVPLDSITQLPNTESITDNKETTSVPGSTINKVVQNFWNVKHSLRGHFDSVRCISFYKNESALLSGSDDGTIKVWNFNIAQLSKKGITSEIEAVQTMRGHDGPVLSLEVFTDNNDPAKPNYAISGGVDRSIRIWQLPNLNTDPYELYDTKQNAHCIPEAHSDAVWNVGMLSNEYLLYSASPYEIKLWSFSTDKENDSENTSPNCDITCKLKTTFVLSNLMTSEVPKAFIEVSRITKVSLMRHDNSQMIIATSTGILLVLDLINGTTKHFINLNSNSDSQSNIEPNITQDGWTKSGIHCIVSHPTLPLVFCGHDDNYLRTVDLSQNSIVHSMVVHQDSVSCMDIEEYGIYLLTGSHDGSLRLWDLEKRSCVQEIASHRAKNNESVISVSFHSHLPFIGSAGAEGIVKIYS